MMIIGDILSWGFSFVPFCSFLCHCHCRYILVVLFCLCMCTHTTHPPASQIIFYALLNDTTFLSLSCNLIWCHMKREPLFHASHYSIPHKSRVLRTTNYWIVKKSLKRERRVRTRSRIFFSCILGIIIISTLALTIPRQWHELVCFFSFNKFVIIFKA